MTRLDDLELCVALMLSCPEPGTYGRLCESCRQKGVDLLLKSTNKGRVKDASRYTASSQEGKTDKERQP